MKKIKLLHIITGLSLLTILFFGLNIRIWIAVPDRLKVSETLKKEVQLLDHANQILSETETKIIDYDQKVSHTVSSLQLPENQREFIAYLEALSQEKKCRTLSLPKETQTEKGAYTLSREIFTLESGLHEIIGLLHQMERQDGVGNIEFLDLKRRKIQVGTSRKTILVADVQLQRILQL